MRYDPFEEFRTLMRNYRAELGISQAELARRMGRKQSYVSELERGIVETPGLVVMSKWAESLGFSIGMWLVINNHYIAINLKAGETPLPPIASDADLLP